MPRDVEALITELLAQPVTAAQLREGAPHSAGLSTADAERVRAHLLASFESRGIPDDAIDIVAEELRTSASPVVLAGAARAVRGMGADAGAEWARLLREAADRVATADVYVRWQPGVVAPTWMRTVRGELLDVLGEIRETTARRIGVGTEAPALELDLRTLRRVRVEDQAGATATMADLLAGHDSIMAFFYTRCMNPARCSLTITRLAGLARSDPDGRTIVAMTYDPDYDSPQRMRRYGAERGFPFGERARLIRASEGWPEVRAMFGLRVGYGPVTVNEHARELFLVGDDLVARMADPDAVFTGPTRG
ncbi:SCO family protein [Microbacterium sp.]|uniref:SCO family protein n=1 Tax=Microbacterium sp. TaxID=51671 RepID=UPI002E375DCD|nr:SCO family protein [Microbacterium sp.]HEX5729481.1 SCO family protein [Microbacterium sp.]